ncbi:MAG: FIST N-terminal domain-containing protein [Candidatus Micrarchaeia archaeon]|jgi:hypothetical protein
MKLASSAIPTSSRGSIRNQVIHVLSEKWPLNGREVYRLLKDRFSTTVTYQGIHKSLRQLVDEGVLSMKDKKYQLDPDWISEMKKFAESVERKYSGSREALKYVEAGTGFSTDPDPAIAGRKAAEQALKELGKKPDFAFVFCHGGTYAKSDESMNSLVAAVDSELKKRNPTCRWIGSTTDGEISDKGCSFNSCTVLVLSSEHISFGVGIADASGKDFFSAGKKAAEAATADLKVIDTYLERYMQFLAVKRKQPNEMLRIKPYVLLTIFPGPVVSYQPNEEELLRGIISVTGITPLVGASSSDSALFRQTYQFANGKAYKNACVVTTMMSDLKLAFTVRHGCSPTKKQVLVTKSEGNCVYTLSGKPAAPVYAKMLGLSMPQLKKKLFDVVIQYPYGIADPLGQYWLKTPFIVNKDNSLQFLNKVPQNSLLVFMKSDYNSILKSTQEALDDIKEKLGSEPPVLIAFSCGSRARTLNITKHAPAAEYQVFKSALPGTKIGGFYTHGEQALIPSGTIGQHNHTIVLLGIANELIGE